MSVANAYAKALFQAAKDRKVSDEGMTQIEVQLNRFVELIEKSKEIQIALLSPLTTPKERVAVISALTQATGSDKLILEFYSLLARKGRLGILRAIKDAFVAVRLEASGGVQGSLVAADQMTGTDVDSLAAAFSKKLGKNVAFRLTVDPTLLAGVKVTVNGVTYDGSLRAQLQRLKESFVRGHSDASGGPA